MYKCPDCNTEYHNWLGMQLCRVCAQRAREIKFEVKIPYSKPTYDALQAMHKNAGKTITYEMAQDLIRDAISKALPGIHELDIQVHVTSTPNWTAFDAKKKEAA